MSKLNVALAGAVVVIVGVVTVAVIWQASEPPARTAEPRERGEQGQREPAPPPEPEPRAVVVSGTLPEDIILGELYAEGLDRSGFAVEHEWGTGALSGPVEALNSGGDVTVGYSDTGAALGDAPEGIEMLRPSQDARSEPVVVTTREVADEYGLEDVADLPGVPGVRVASTPATEADPLEALWPLLPPPAGPNDFRPSDDSEAVGLMREGEVAAIAVDSFSGAIAANGLVVLDDGSDLVTDDAAYPAPVVGSAFVSEHPEARGALEAVSEDLTTEDVRDLVAATEANGGDPEQPGADYYAEEVDGE